MIGMGLGRLGQFIEFIPHPVTTGFTAGIATVIATLQIKDVFGLRLTRSPDSFFDRIAAMWQARGTASLAEAGRPPAGADGQTLTLTPGASGNFNSRTRVMLPYRAKLTYMGRERAMGTAQTTGDCNSCHTQTGANAAPGRILLP